MYNVLVLGDK